MFASGAAEHHARAGKAAAGVVIATMILGWTPDRGDHIGLGESLGVATSEAAVTATMVHTRTRLGRTSGSSLSTVTAAATAAVAGRRRRARTPAT